MSLVVVSGRGPPRGASGLQWGPWAGRGDGGVTEGWGRGAPLFEFLELMTELVSFPPTLMVELPARGSLTAKGDVGWGGVRVGLGWGSEGPRNPLRGAVQEALDRRTPGCQWGKLPK